MSYLKGKTLFHKLKSRWLSRTSREYPPSLICMMPVEVLEAIAIPLKPSEFCAFRLTCRVIYERTAHSFGRIFLKTVHIDLSGHALERLSMVAEHPHLRQHVQLLVIQEPQDNLLGREISWARHSSGHLLLPQKAIQQWQTVLSRLVSCKGFEIRREHSVESSDSSILRSSDAITVVLSIIFRSIYSRVNFCYSLQT
jgi:hypothetical protein